jgi:hypothetical protein
LQDPTKFTKLGFLVRKYTVWQPCFLTQINVCARQHSIPARVQENWRRGTRNIKAKLLQARVARFFLEHDTKTGKMY